MTQSRYESPCRRCCIPELVFGTERGSGCELVRCGRIAAYQESLVGTFELRSAVDCDTDHCLGYMD